MRYRDFLEKCRTYIKKFKKYWILLILVAVVLVSIKPLLFTWNFILANFNLADNKEAAEDRILKSLRYNPSSYKFLIKYHQTTVERLIVKSAIYRNDINQLEALGMNRADTARTKSNFKDNFYFQHLLKNPDQKRKWQNLDEVSFDVLADPDMNPLTLQIFEKIGSSFDRDFIENLKDFCLWKGNPELGRTLVAKYPVQSKYEGDKEKFPAVYVESPVSMEKLKKVLAEKYPPAGAVFESNLLECFSFDDKKNFEKNWYFSDMAGKPPYSDASFTIGLDRRDEHGMLRIMGFFLDNEKEKQRARGGVWSKKRFFIEKGVYLFSFDYFTKTGRENPSFFLGKGIKTVKLPDTGKTWKKVIYILNNASNRHRVLKPLIRIWGTGSMWVDNVYLGRIADPGFSLPAANALYLEEWK